MSNILERAIFTLGMDFVYIVLIFILLFTVVFAVLQKIQLFGDKSKRYNMAVAFVLGLVPVFQHYLMPGQPSAIDVIVGVIPNMAVLIIAVVMLLILVGVFGANISLGDNKATGWIILLAVISVFVVFASEYGLGWYSLPYWISDDVILIAVALLVFGIIVAFVTADETDKKKPTLGEELSKIVKTK
ncbi:MAG: hypothetical protein ACMXYA_02845 [Candidatus Woesearchaeota archaeon]